MSKAHILVVVPTYGGIEPETVKTLMQMGDAKDIEISVDIGKPCSLLAKGFNQLWATALTNRKRKGYTHLCMLHSDVAGPPGWLIHLYHQQQMMKADVMSVIVPIKSKHGRTSTGIYDVATRNIKRFTLKELFKMGGRTFSIEQITKEPGKILAVNTGMWICDFTKEWVKPPFKFEIRDDIVQVRPPSKEFPEGEYEERTMPEDWGASIMWAAMGLRVYATRVFGVGHIGRYVYDSFSGWGDETDTGGD